MNQYAKLVGDEMEEHLSNYLIPHWSVSGVKCFNRNQKEFEKSYVYRDRSNKSSVAGIIGRCYHKALMEFFIRYKRDKTVMSIEELQYVGHIELTCTPANAYKPSLSKTVDEQKILALNALNSLLVNFLGEVDFYLDDIQEIIFVEQLFMEFIVLDDEDIPIPVKFIPDLFYVNKKGYLSGIDHKSKYAYSKPGDVDITCSQQAICYSKGIEQHLMRPEYASLIKKYPKIKDGVRFFSFYENKYSKNRDNSNQIRKVTIDIKENSVIYEFMLYEGVWKMIQAVSNPDHIYNINQDDFYCDREELFDFWMRTKLDEMDAFPKLTESQKKFLARRRDHVKKSFVMPNKKVIEQYRKKANFISYNNKFMEGLKPTERIENRLMSLGFPTQVAHFIDGYSCDTYLMEVKAGIQINKVFKYAMDIASALDVSNVRIASDLARYQKKSYLCIEVNKDDRKGLMISDQELPNTGGIALGRDNYQNEIAWDIDSPSSPHLLIAGATGSGKSVAIETIIRSALARGMKLTIMDPKFEFTKYKTQCEVFNEQDDIVLAMMMKVEQMDEFYKSGKKMSSVKEMIIFDEASDCFSRQGRDKTLEKNTLLLAQKARAASMHLVLSSQRWSVKVMTGDAKANFTTRLCLTVASEVDSKVMLDDVGAEKLNGLGDALFRSPEMSQPTRMQCYMVT